MSLPPYRRSHLRSKTYETLVRIFSRFPPSTVSNQSLNVSDNGNVEKGQENQEKEPKCTEVKVGSNVMDPKDPIPLKEIHGVSETVKIVGDKSNNFSANETFLDNIEFLMGRDEPSALTNDFGLEQKLMDELELILKGTEDPACDNSLIPLNNEKQNRGSEVDLMDYQVEHAEFLQSGTNASGSVSELQLQVPEELYQLASKGFHVHESKKGQISDSVISTSSIKHESQQKETELGKLVCPVVASLPSIQEGEFETEEQYSHKLAEETQNSLDMDTNIEALNMTEDGGLLDSTISKDKYEIQNGEKSEKLICVKNATNSSAILIKEEDLEEIPGDFAMDGNTLDAIILEPTKVDEIQKPDNLFGNMVSPFKLGVSLHGFPSNSLMSNAIQDASSNGQVGPRTISAIPTNLTQNQVLRKGFLEETAIKDHQNSSAVQEVIDATKKRASAPDSEEKEDMKKMVDDSTSKRGSGSQEKKMLNEMKYRKNMAEKKRELGVKRLKLIPVQKSKPIPYCRQYKRGGCREGDKCNFLHDTVPVKKSMPCAHFARHYCMKGDDCPFDHQLSKYPCPSFVSKGSCIIGDTCMFSHQVPANQDILMPANDRKPEFKSPLSSGNTNLGTPPNNHGTTSSVQQNHSTNSEGIYSHINAAHKVTESSQTQPTSAPKGIRFINFANLSASPSTPKQDPVTPNKGSLVRNVACTDKGQNTAEIPKKLPALIPKGISCLSFGKGSVGSFKSSIQPIAEEMVSKLPQSVNFGLSEHSISSLNKDDYGKVSIRTPQAALFSQQILDKNQSTSELMKSKFLEKDLTDVSVRDQSQCKSVQEVNKASDNSQTSTVTSPTLLARPFVSHQASEGLVSGYHNQASSSSQRALLSTLDFAADRESDIKMKSGTGTSPAWSEKNK